MRPVCITVVLCAALLTVGCGSSGPATSTVSGKVTLDDQPLPDGQIAFVTEDGLGAGVGDIKNGQYRCQVKGGKFKVKITANKKMPLPPGKKGLHGETEMEMNYIPEAFNEKTTLTADVSGAKVLDFALKSK